MEKTKKMVRAELRGYLRRADVGQTVEHVLAKFDAAWSAAPRECWEKIRRMPAEEIAKGLRVTFSIFQFNSHTHPLYR